MTTTGKQRIQYIDFMKGLCILFIVISHTDDRLFALGGQNLNYTLQSFRIPMYYFISGIFFKLYAGLGDFARRKVNNILVPLVFFYLAAFAFHWLAQYLPPAQHFYGNFSWSMLWDPLCKRQWVNNAPLWFLMSLFEVNVIYYLLQRFIPDRRWVALAGICLSGFGFYLAAIHAHAPLLIDTAFIGLPYFILGSEAKRYGALNPSRYDRWGWVALLVFVAALYPFAQEINILHQRLPNYPYLYLVPTVSILLLLWSCKRLRYIPIINYIGRYSIVVLCTHYPLVIPVRRGLKTLLFHSTNEHEMLLSALAVMAILLIELVLIRLLTRYLPWFTAQKEFFTPGWRLFTRKPD